MSETVVPPVAETPKVTELHTEALEALHTARDATQAYLDHTDVADATVLHVAAQHTVGLLDQALVAMHGSAQAVAEVDPPPEGEEPVPLPTPIAHPVPAPEA